MRKAIVSALVGCAVLMVSSYAAAAKAGDFDATVQAGDQIKGQVEVAFSQSLYTVTCARMSPITKGAITIKVNGKVLPPIAVNGPIVVSINDVKPVTSSDPDKSPVLKYEFDGSDDLQPNDYGNGVFVSCGYYKQS